LGIVKRAKSTSVFITPSVPFARKADNNYEVETENKEPADVAKAFLTEKGLVK